MAFECEELRDDIVFRYSVGVSYARRHAWNLEDLYKHAWPLQEETELCVCG